MEAAAPQPMTHDEMFERALMLLQASGEKAVAIGLLSTEHLTQMLCTLCGEKRSLSYSFTETVTLAGGAYGIKGPLTADCSTFETQAALNAFIEERTRGRFKNILPADSPRCLVSTATQNEEFRYAFSPSSTTIMPFGNGSSCVNMMYNHQAYLPAYMTTDGVQAVVLPYRSGCQAVVIGHSNKDVCELNVDTLKKAWAGVLDAPKCSFVLGLPKHDICTGPVNFTEQMRQLWRICCPSAEQYFDSTFGEDGQVLVGAHMTTNESGTECGSFNACMARCMPPSKNIVFSWPHYFMVTDSDNNITFACYVTAE